MKIAVRGSASRRLIKKLERSGAMELVGGAHNDLFFDAKWPSADLDECLRGAARHGAIDLNPWMEFTGAEINTADLLHVRPRKVVEDSNTDYERMRDQWDELPWIGDNPQYRCKLPDQVFLTRIPLKPNQVAVVGQWTAEYLVPRAIRDIFERAGLTGAEFRTVTKTKTGEPIPDFFHLYSDRLLPPRRLDPGTRRIHSPDPAEQGFDVMGAFCYDAEALAGATDFNRTGEANVGFQFPELIVSRAVRELFAEHLLKGWAFAPVLDIESRLYTDYASLWQSLYELLLDCRKHTVRGQQVEPVSAGKPTRIV